ncbi:MAG: hypothetical protein M1828_003360 [Chrysothrix sp. TS-e1954]|nr:MAG: hypothetical protein M1828_003360 [Chrysothrix sp. TS-e1954]
MGSDFMGSDFKLDQRVEQYTRWEARPKHLYVLNRTWINHLGLKSSPDVYCDDEILDGLERALKSATVVASMFVDQGCAGTIPEHDAVIAKSDLKPFLKPSQMAWRHALLSRDTFVTKLRLLTAFLGAAVLREDPTMDVAALVELNREVANPLTRVSYLLTCLSSQCLGEETIKHNDWSEDFINLLKECEEAIPDYKSTTTTAVFSAAEFAAILLRMSPEFQKEFHRRMDAAD